MHFFSFQTFDINSYELFIYLIAKANRLNEQN